MGLLDDAKKAADSEKGENVTDSAIDKAGDFASDKTGGKYDDQIDKAGRAADDKIGD